MGNESAGRVPDVAFSPFEGQYTRLDDPTAGCPRPLRDYPCGHSEHPGQPGDTFPTMALGCFAGCTGDPLQNSGDLQLLPGRQLKTEGAASAVATCADTAVPECVNRESGERWGNTRQGEDYLDATLPAENQVESKAFDVMIQIRDWDVSPGSRSCTNLGDQSHSPGEDCSNVEAGSDYTEAISVLTVAIIAMLTLAVIPFAWVMHRSYRTWRLRRRGAVGKFGPAMR